MLNALGIEQTEFYLFHTDRRANNPRLFDHEIAAGLIEEHDSFHANNYLTWPANYQHFVQHGLFQAIALLQ